MNATLLMLINSAAVTLEDLVEAINSHEGRETSIEGRHQGREVRSMR